MSTPHTLPGEIVVDGLLLPGKFMTKEAIDQIATFNMYPQDTLIATYPRSGTTWVSEIAFILNSDFNFDLAKSEFMINRVPFLEEGSPLGSSSPIDLAAAMKPPRVMKTHLPFKFYSKHVLQDKAKAVVVLRNPKDTLASFYNMYKANKVYGNYKGSWAEFLGLFHAKKLGNGDWFEINNSWWEQRHLPNILVLKYEDLKSNFDEEVNRLAKFMGKEINKENMVKLKEHVKFDSMQANPCVNPIQSQDNNISRFIRKGEVGDWKNYFTVAQNEHFELTYMPQIDKAGMKFTYQ